MGIFLPCSPNFVFVIEFGSRVIWRSCVFCFNISFCFGSVFVWWGWISLSLRRFFFWDTYRNLACFGLKNGTWWTNFAYFMKNLLNTLYILFSGLWWIVCSIYFVHGISDGGSDHAGLPQPDWLNMWLMLGYHCKNHHKDLNEVSYYL